MMSLWWCLLSPALPLPQHHTHKHTFTTTTTHTLTNYIGKPSALYDCDNPDWIPTLKMDTTTVVTSDQTSERNSRRRLKARKRKRLDITAAESLLLLASDPGHDSETGLINMLATS